MHSVFDCFFLGGVQDNFGGGELPPRKPMPGCLCMLKSLDLIDLLNGLTNNIGSDCVSSIGYEY